MHLEQANMLPFFALLRAGVNGDTSLDVADIDWEAAEKMAAAHNVLPLLFDGCQKYYEQRGLIVPNDIKFRLFAAAQYAERHYANHLQAINTLSDYYADHDLRIMVLKGYGLSLCYPKPNHRPCGDIDIYQFGDFKIGDDLLEMNARIRIDRTHHHHTCFVWNGISVENHYDFVNVYTHPINRQLDETLKQIASKEDYEISEHGILLPSPNLMALFTFVHSAAHFAAEGVEVRHIVDWFLLRKHYGDRVDWQKVATILDDLGFGQFYNIWNELADILFTSKNLTLSFEAKKVLNEILSPKFAQHLPKKTLCLLWFKLRRWWGSRWKMKLVYQKESLLQQFVTHLHSHLLRPEKLLKTCAQ